MRTLYLIRHGQPQVQDAHTCGYAQDVPLSQAGQRQAERLGAWAKNVSLAAVYSSPSLRCLQTAQVLAGDRIPVQTEDGLSEVDTGLWTGLTFEEIKRN